MPQKILFISQRINDMSSGARVVSRANLATLREALGEESVDVYEIRKKRGNPIRRHALKIGGFLDGLTPEDVRRVTDIVQRDKIDTVYIDSSYFGKLAQGLRKASVKVRIIVFYHDVLVHWWKETHGRNPLSFVANYLVYFISERRCAFYADRALVMTERDASLLRNIYGMRNKPIDVTPLTVPDPVTDNYSGKTVGYDYLLFIGVDYKPNIDGLAWFLEHVQPRISLPLVIVGKGMDAYKDRFERESVRVIGAVEDLRPWYRDALACVIPLFAGSGMKVKTAEALSHGKRIYATDEGLIGYKVEGVDGIVRCNEANEFIAALRELEGLNNPERFIEAIRDVYLRDHSPQAAVKKITSILHD